MADKVEGSTVQDALSWEADWVQRNTGITLTPDQARCVDTLSVIQRPYNWQVIDPGWRGAVTWPYPELDDGFGDDAPRRHPVEFGNGYMIVRIRSTLATFDLDELTRLVLAAHRNAVRVEISADSYLATDYDGYECERQLVDGKLQWVETDEHPTYTQACLRVQLNARGREGSNWERHPTIEDILR